jgi:hypothetical protein
MAAETLRPAQRSRRETVYEKLSAALCYFGFLVPSIIGSNLGFWPSVLAAGALVLSGALVFVWLTVPLRKARLDSDRKRGLIECAVRSPHAPPGTLQDRWKPGYAEIRHGTMRFQALYGDIEEPSGPISTFSGITALHELPRPEKRSVAVKRKWKILAMITDQGLLEIAAGQAGVQLLELQSR